MRTSLPDTTPSVAPLGSMGAPVITRFPEYCDPVCLRLISTEPPPSAARVAVHVPTHFPVTSTVGATVAVPVAPAHPATMRAAKAITTGVDVFIRTLLAC